MARIATVCTDERSGTTRVDMGSIRWYEISRALAELGHEVDIVHGRSKWRLRQPVVELAPRLREVPLARVDWSAYDAIKTLFHRGFDTLERRGGADHPLIIAKLGSVVGPSDRPGIYFFGEQRALLYRIQERIARRARYVTLLSEPARALWRDCHGGGDELLLVPGAAPRRIPDSGPDPYPAGAASGARRALFAGTIYSTHPMSQPGAHRTITDKLNRLGSALADRGVALYVIGPGEAESLDAAHVHHLGAVPYERSWDYMRHADVGVVVSAGDFMHNNESTKIYHYLRAGLPVVSESGFPNDNLIRDSGHGSVVEAGDPDALTGAVVDAVAAGHDRGAAEAFVVREHTWLARARVYDELLRAHPDGRTGS